MWSIRSRCEWKDSTTVNGTLRRYSMIKPSVTSSGNLILSPIDTSRPLLATGIIFIAKARLIQNPAPPVANQNFIFWFSWPSLVCFLLSKLLIACRRDEEVALLLQFVWVWTQCCRKILFNDAYRIQKHFYRRRDAGLAQVPILVGVILVQYFN